MIIIKVTIIFGKKSFYMLAFNLENYNKIRLTKKKKQKNKK